MYIDRYTHKCITIYLEYIYNYNYVFIYILKNLSSSSISESHTGLADKTQPSVAK